MCLKQATAVSLEELRTARWALLLFSSAGRALWIRLFLLLSRQHSNLAAERSCDWAVFVLEVAARAEEAALTSHVWWHNGARPLSACSDAACSRHSESGLARLPANPPPRGSAHRLDDPPSLHGFLMLRHFSSSSPVTLLPFQTFPTRPVGIHEYMHPSVRQVDRSSADPTSERASEQSCWRGAGLSAMLSFMISLDSGYLPYFFLLQQYRGCQRKKPYLGFRAIFVRISNGEPSTSDPCEATRPLCTHDRIIRSTWWRMTEDAIIWRLLQPSGEFPIDVLSMDDADGFHMACLHLMRAIFQLASSVFRIAQCKPLDAYIHSLISYFLSEFVSSFLRNSDLFRSPCSWIVRWHHHAYPVRIGVSRTMALVVLELETYLTITQCMDGIALRLGLPGFWST